MLADDGLTIERGALNARAYAVLRKALMAGRFQPGQKLLLRTLATEMGISVTPVREALLRLVSEHALVADSSRTLAVPVLSLQRFLEIRDLRIELEGRATEAATRRASPAELDALVSIQEQLMQRRQDGLFAEALAVNETFHFALYRLARMPVLYRLIEGLWVQIGPVLTRLHDRMERPNPEFQHPHELIVRAMRQGDATSARLALAGDITWASRHLAAGLEPEASDHQEGSACGV